MLFETYLIINKLSIFSTSPQNVLFALNKTCLFTKDPVSPIFQVEDGAAHRSPRLQPNCSALRVRMLPGTHCASLHLVAALLPLHSHHVCSSPYHGHLPNLPLFFLSVISPALCINSFLVDSKSVSPLNFLFSLSFYLPLQRYLSPSGYNPAKQKGSHLSERIWFIQSFVVLLILPLAPEMIGSSIRLLQSASEIPTPFPRKRRGHPLPETFPHPHLYNGWIVPFSIQCYDLIIYLSLVGVGLSLRAG